MVQDHQIEAAVSVAIHAPQRSGHSAREIVSGHLELSGSAVDDDGYVGTAVGGDEIRPAVAVDVRGDDEERVRRCEKRDRLGKVSFDMAQVNLGQSRVKHDQVRDAVRVQIFEAPVSRREIEGDARA